MGGQKVRFVDQLKIGSVLQALPSGSILSGSDAELHSLEIDEDLIVSGSIFTNLLQILGGIGTQGTFTWNNDEETVDLIQNGTTLQLGQELHIHVRNNTTSSINNGVNVMATGTLGASGRITIDTLISDGSVPAMFYLGVTTEIINPGEDGKVTIFGKVRDVDTSMWSEGTVLWTDPAIRGGFTITEPEAPNLKLPIAFVINSHAQKGTLMVRYSKGDSLHDLHDVYVSHPPEDYSLLTYVSSSRRWEAVKEINVDKVTATEFTGSINDPNLVRNSLDTFLSSSKVKEMVSLQQSEYDNLPSASREDESIMYVIVSGSNGPTYYMSREYYDPRGIIGDVYDMRKMYGTRVTNSTVSGSYEIDRHSGSLWELTMEDDTEFIDINLPNNFDTNEIKIILSGSHVPSYPSYWSITGDTYNGNIRNMLTLTTINGNTGDEDVICIVRNII